MKKFLTALAIGVTAVAPIVATNNAAHALAPYVMCYEDPTNGTCQRPVDVRYPQRLNMIFTVPTGNPWDKCAHYGGDHLNVVLMRANGISWYRYICVDIDY